MKRYSFTFLLVLVAIISSCASNTNGKSAGAKAEQEVPGLAAIDSLREGTPFRLCEQSLTSLEAVSKAFPDSCENYDVEMTPVRYAFYFPQSDIKQTDIATRVRIRYNMVSVMNRVVHSYEWYIRAVTSVDDTLMTRRDTLDLIRHSQPELPDALLSEVLPAEPGKKARVFLRAYRRFDGDDSEDSPFSKVFQNYGDAITAYPMVATEDMLDSLAVIFWDWYDKANFVPCIDDIIRMHLSEAPKFEMTEGRLEHFRNAVLSEKDIDRRAVLALEYAKFDDLGGIELLGEIIESGQYTRYLYEVWMSWRARVQMYHALSSFSVIPNNYYDMLRVKCIDTLLRHYQTTGDWTALCFIENFIYAGVLHRQGSITGNESLAICANLAYGMFIHPRITGVDPLKD